MEKTSTPSTPLSRQLNSASESSMPKKNKEKEMKGKNDMYMAAFAKIWVVLVIGQTFVCRVAAGNPNTSVVDKICNGVHFGQDDAFGTDIVSVLNV